MLLLIDVFFSALPLQFPQEKPIITVSPCVNHPWVDASSYRVIGCPAINTVRYFPICH